VSGNGTVKSTLRNPSYYVVGVGNDYVCDSVRFVLTFFPLAGFSVLYVERSVVTEITHHHDSFLSGC